MLDSHTQPLAERIQEEFHGAMSIFVVLLGYRLGLLRALHAHGPVTASELADITGYDERYVREWLAAMAAGGYILYTAASDETTPNPQIIESFSLTPEQAAVFVDADSPAYAMPSLVWAPRLAAILPALEEAFLTGGGVPYARYATGAADGAGDSNRLDYMTNLAAWLRADPDLWRRVQDASTVLDVGCGHGWSSIALARALPAATIIAVDADSASLAVAQTHVDAAGLADRIQLHLAEAESLDRAERCDLITAFECVHDMAHPVRSLRRLREHLKTDGILLVADERMGDTLRENLNPLGHINYNWSVLQCLPQARIDDDSAATGCAMGPALLQRYATEAGFDRFEILPIEHPIWRFYRLGAAS